MTHRTSRPLHKAASKAASHITGPMSRARPITKLRTTIDEADAFKASAATLRRAPSDRETEGASRHVHARRHRDVEIKFFTIAEVAERLHVAGRTVRRWIVAGDLVVFRAGSIVRVAESDLRAFLAVHREG
jgi:excisionase family DNA binding protein